MCEARSELIHITEQMFLTHYPSRPLRSQFGMNGTSSTTKVRAVRAIVLTIYFEGCCASLMRWISVLSVDM